MTKPDYSLYVPFVLRWEGGVVDDKDDKGGLTNAGVTYETYLLLAQKIYKVTPNLVHFHLLTPDEVGLMIKYFWDVATCKNSINSQKIAEAITSWNWGSGKQGLIWWQKMMNENFKTKLTVDGVVGSKTVEAINFIDEDLLFDMALIYRRDTFRRIVRNNPSQNKFLRGWLNRLNDFAKRHKSSINIFEI